MPQQIEIKSRRGLSSAWASVNPILAEGEPGFETNTYKLKIGDGTTPWNDLRYFTFDGGDLDNTGVASALLLNFDGGGGLMSPISAMNGNSIIDSSPNGFTVTKNGNVVLTNSSKFGAGALQLSSGEYLTIAHDARLNLINNPFTMEAWVYVNGTGLNVIASKRISGEYYSGFMFQVENRIPKFLASSTGSSWDIELQGQQINQSSWVHLAVCHVRGSWKLFVDGNLEASQNSSVSISSNSGDFAIGAGAANGSQNSFDGKIDDFRLTVGLDIYEQNFSVPTSALSSVNIFRKPSSPIITPSAIPPTPTPSPTPTATPEPYPSLLSMNNKKMHW
jgi:hypothetical protein